MNKILYPLMIFFFTSIVLADIGFDRILIDTDDHFSAYSIGDIDGDGDLDILTAGYTTKLAWYENQGNNSYKKHAISHFNESGASSLLITDIDNDGDGDIVIARTGVYLYKNDGSETFNNKTTILSSQSYYAGAGSFEQIIAHDIDKDNDLDILGASGNRDELLWFKNSGDDSWNKSVLATPNGPSDIFVYDFDKFTAKHWEDNVFNYSQFFFGDLKISMDLLPAFGQDLMKYVIGYLGITKKCIVLDLDNTLWGGIIGEDGFNGIKLGPEPPGNAFMEFQRVLLSLHERGIILAINSKNNFEDAIKVIKEHPYMILKEEHFAAMCINWNDKVSNMRKLIKEINIGSDSLVFIDDDPVNREFVKLTFPEILVINLSDDPSTYVKEIENLIDFSVLKITDEDKNRGKMYLKQKKITELEKTSTNLQTFLNQLELKISIKQVNEFTLPRVSQLILKTNQFNLTTKRYQEKDIEKMIKDSDFLVTCVQVEDKFGDNGITGVFIIKKENQKEWKIDTFLMSCRIMGRDIEKGIITYIINKAKENNIQKINADFIPTQKNKPIENFLSDHEFNKEGQSWTYHVKSTIEFPKYLKIEEE